MWKRFHVKYPLFLCDFNEIWILSTDFRKKSKKYQVSSNPVQWESGCSIRTDVRTDMTKLIVAFRDSANAPKNSWWCEFEVFTAVSVTIAVFRDLEVFRWVRDSQRCHFQASQNQRKTKDECTTFFRSARNMTRHHISQDLKLHFWFCFRWRLKCYHLCNNKISPECFTGFSSCQCQK